MKRLPVFLAAGAVWLAGIALPEAQARAVEGAALCDTGLYEIRAGYEGARANACRVLAPRGVVLTIEPEDAPPINPSPWYGFHVRPKQASEEGTIVVTLRYTESRHRYWPKVSADRAQWERLPERHWLAHEDGRATMELKPGPEGLFVSAQELVGLDFYESWRQAMSARYEGLSWHVIGNTEENRPLFATQTEPGAPNYLLLIGRQHPPEVPGALMFAGFAEALLADRASACADAGSARCSFYAQHNLGTDPEPQPRRRGRRSLEAQRGGHRPESRLGPGSSRRRRAP